MSDPHYAIKRLDVLDGGSEQPDAPIDLIEFSARQGAKFCLMNHEARVAALNAIDNIISRDESALRQKSQLVTLRTKLGYTHEILRKANR